MARKLGIDPATIITETNPWVNAARYAAAHIYDNADEKQAREAEAKAGNRR